MLNSVAERAWAWLHSTFPERQIYIRSDGRVQFFTFGPAFQATIAGLSLVFLGWVAFASVNVLFKDRIIAATNGRYRQMQATYENRVADLQVSYDELNGALVTAEDKFKSEADRLRDKQQAVGRLLGDKALAGLKNIPRGNAKGPGIRRVALSAGSGDSIATAAPMGIVAYRESGGNSELRMLPEAMTPQPRTASPVRTSFVGGTFKTLVQAAGTLFRLTPRREPVSRAVLRNPAFQFLSQQTNRVRRMSGAEDALLTGVDAELTSRISNVQGVMRRVGLNPNRFERGAGGPFIPISNVRFSGIDDPAFTAAYTGAAAHGKELDSLFAALRHVPLTTPVHGAQFELTSDFGPRVDPFTHRIGFHPGLDFAGPWGSTVAATAPGTVVFAGHRGGYGNMVEIDHGYGIHTRYGHLASISVHVGEKVAKGSPVGRLGSTGRSTGPHVHYEIWLADALKDPSRFIEAGRHVHKN